MFEKVQLLEVTENNDGQRIDNFLMTLLKGVPRSKIYRILRKGEVRVNGSRSKPARRIVIGDVIRVPPVRVADRPLPRPSFDAAALLSQRMLEEDDDYLLLDKPGGMAVHAGSGIEMGLIEGLKLHLGPDFYVELAHRLDKETSGCLLIARHRKALLHFQQQMLANRVVKRYLVLVRGNPSTDKILIDAPLRKGALQSGERMVRVDAGGKAAVTEFLLLERFHGCSLLQATLHTGRTHQIRVHAAHMGCPVAGDRKYGDRAFNAQLAQRGLSRLFLHASYLSFDKRDAAEQYVFSAPLPDELASVCGN